MGTHTTIDHTHISPEHTHSTYDHYHTQDPHFHKYRDTEAYVYKKSSGSWSSTEVRGGGSYYNTRDTQSTAPTIHRANGEVIGKSVEVRAENVKVNEQEQTPVTNIENANIGQLYPKHIRV